MFEGNNSHLKNHLRETHLLTYLINNNLKKKFNRLFSFILEAVIVLYIIRVRSNREVWTIFGQYRSTFRWIDKRSLDRSEESSV